MQLGSDAVFGRVPRSIGTTVYLSLERVAPAQYVEEMLARNALTTDDLVGAAGYALRLPASASRNELLAQIAERRGDAKLALEYYLVAPDVAAVDRYVTGFARNDPSAAYALESNLLARLQALTTHPDAVAEAYWTLGRLATRRGYLSPKVRSEAWRLSLVNYRKAIALAPFSEKYWLALGNQDVLMEDWPGARAAFASALGVNPKSADAATGLALAARHGAT
ncbi:MAG: hypothetical protein M3R30_08825 [Candidatus Eremiobacteraeota bacterium]|nr:hypothetical protein [Candidatus Eremiobacteraeota bacterium]